MAPPKGPTKDLFDQVEDLVVQGTQAAWTFARAVSGVLAHTVTDAEWEQATIFGAEVIDTISGGLTQKLRQGLGIDGVDAVAIADQRLTPSWQ